MLKKLPVSRLRPKVLCRLWYYCGLYKLWHNDVLESLSAQNIAKCIGPRTFDASFEIVSYGRFDHAKAGECDGVKCSWVNRTAQHQISHWSLLSILAGVGTRGIDTIYARIREDRHWVLLTHRRTEALLERLMGHGFADHYVLRIWTILRLSLTTGFSAIKQSNRILAPVHKNEFKRRSPWNAAFWYNSSERTRFV